MTDTIERRLDQIGVSFLAPMLPKKHRIHTFNEVTPKKYFSIGETSKECNVAPSCLRFWEKEFKVQVNKKNGIRKYTREQVAFFMEIAAMTRVEGLTLKWLKSHKEERDLKEMDIQNAWSE